MNGHAGPKVLVLYTITNAKGESTSGSSSYNAFELPAGSQVSLGHAKRYCRALQKINVAGADGYHWRVRVDDKVTNPKGPLKYSWWDIQDENAKLPVREVTFTELSHILSPPRKSSSSVADDSVSKSVSSVTRSLGKAMNKVAATVDGTSSSSTYDNGPRVPIVMFKLLDLTKVYDSFSNSLPVAPRTSSDMRKTQTRQPTNNAGYAAPTPTPTRAQVRQRVPQQQTAPKPTPSRQAPPQRRPAPAQKEGSLMDFGDAPAPRPMHHTNGVSSSAPKVARPTETRAQKLKREYEQKKRTENRVWDDVDQRWVTVDPKTANGGTVKKASQSAPPGVADSSGADANKPKLKGVSLDNVNLAGKSAAVATAVQSRVNEMKTSQQKALNEIREREAAKKKSEDEEDVVRRRLEPKIKAWAEEHGKKKQLRALLASLDTILWPGAKWKPVNLGDLLDDRKVKLNFHKASRVVHPDKTMSLNAEERFIAKRIFDALSQAKTEFDNSK
eukprot:CAMPEP_0204625526 /NCGR_PEP_ID=MMETSP0717-20131115/11270_1 /ASSEMBLY_ACC=CAM_ASM_000666 /TAXON_ID=230516 /ORGANISM="Chaetoceros curvisetus" /LENGTH=499 /DNA_ID=CAMNT_0051641249 /DNA_START=28 /DNA_END=1527 /DNA_ORIENTATION=+